jgi:hypothetical protein
MLNPRLRAGVCQNRDRVQLPSPKGFFFDVGHAPMHLSQLSGHGGKALSPIISVSASVAHATMFTQEPFSVYGIIQHRLRLDYAAFVDSEFFRFSFDIRFKRHIIISVRFIRPLMLFPNPGICGHNVMCVYTY